MNVAGHSDKGRALITGIGGFTGRHLARTLRHAGYDVYGTVQAESDANEHCFAADLLDADALDAIVQRVRPRVVAHLAAISFVAHGNADTIYAVNLLGSRHLLQALGRLPEPPAAVLLASSGNIFGQTALEVLDETAQPCPGNDYGVSKLAMEHMARLWLDRLPITVVRPFNYTGLGQDSRFVLPKIVEHFRRRASVIELGNLDVERDFSDVRRVVAAYEALLSAPAPGELFHVCSGRLYSLRQVLRTMTDLTGHTMEVRVNPAFVRQHEITRLRGNPAKLQNFVPQLPDFELADTLKWMLHGNAGDIAAALPTN